MLDKLGKHAASKKFVKAYDKYTLALCGTAAVAYGMQQYFVRVFSSRQDYFQGPKSVTSIRPRRVDRRAVAWRVRERHRFIPP